MKTIEEHSRIILNKSRAFPWAKEAQNAFRLAVKEALRDQRHRCAENSCSQCHTKVMNAYLEEN